MAGYGLRVVECHGHGTRVVVTASDYDELVEKIAAKTGIAIDPADIELVADGGEGGDE